MHPFCVYVVLFCLHVVLYVEAGSTQTIFGGYVIAATDMP